MGNFLDTVLVVGILSFLGFMVWSRVMNQTMFETFKEIKSMFTELQDKE